MKVNTIQRKKAMAGFREVSGKERTLGMLVNVINNGKQALDSLMLEMGRSVAESIMLIEREEIAGPDYYPTNANIQKWAHEDGSVYVGDQKIKVKRPRLRDIVDGEIPLQSYQNLRKSGQFSEEILEKILRGVSAQEYEETVLEGFCCFDPQKPMCAPGEHSEFELLERHPFATTILSDHHEDSGARHYPRLGFEQAEQPQ